METSIFIGDRPLYVQMDIYFNNFHEKPPLDEKLLSEMPTSLLHFGHIKIAQINTRERSETFFAAKSPILSDFKSVLQKLPNLPTLNRQKNTLRCSLPSIENFRFSVKFTLSFFDLVSVGLLLADVKIGKICL